MIRYGLYPVITEKFCINGSAVRTLEKVLDAGVKIVQLREKEYPKNYIYKMAVKFKKLTEKYGAFLIINDHVDIAVAVNANGVHLGQSDMPCSAVKKMAPELIVGVSTHNYREAVKAKNDGADYINIGPVFKTKTKKIGYAPLGMVKMKGIANAVNMPFSVMGGIKEKNLIELLDEGAGLVALITEITMDKNPGLKAKRMLRIIEQHRLNKGH